jgi:hypothetical protein
MCFAYGKLYTQQNAGQATDTLFIRLIGHRSRGIFGEHPCCKSKLGYINNGNRFVQSSPELFTMQLRCGSPLRQARVTRTDFDGFRTFPVEVHALQTSSFLLQAGRTTIRTTVLIFVRFARCWLDRLFLNTPNELA